jgi:hypothetical protein
MKEQSNLIQKNPDLSVEQVDPRLIQEILLAIRNIHYGSVEILIHDSRVVQLERREKVRFNSNGSVKEK